MPSSFSVSSAYSISFRLSSTSGSGSDAQIPKRPGKSAFIFAPNSLASRAIATTSFFSRAPGGACWLPNPSQK
jgi:hypothetical protein